MTSIYLDYNATTPVRPVVREAMLENLAGGPGNPSSRHRWGQAAAAAREQARERLAEAAGCRPGSVVFTSGGTEADNLALRGSVGTGGKRHLLTAATEHEAILQTAEALADEGCETTLLPVDGEGRVAPDDLAAAIRPDTAVVSLMAANNETGVLLPLRQLGELCRERGVLFHTDAVQFFGKGSFRFDDLPVDLASVSSHKIGGPKGSGALLVREGLSLRPEITGGSQESRIRPGTENLPGIVGFGMAAAEACADLPREGPRLAALRDRLESGLRERFPRALVNGGGTDRLPNTSNVSFPGLAGGDLLVALDLEGVAVSTGAACTSGAAAPSHVLLAMGRTAEEASGSLRFSLGWETTMADIDQVLAILTEITSRLGA